MGCSQSTGVVSATPTSKEAPQAGGDAAKAATGAIDPSVDQDYNKKALAAHNKYRALHGVPPVEIDWDVALGAQQWADKMSADGEMKHSGGDERPGCGENLAMHSDEKLLKDTDAATDMWYLEINDPGYDFDSPGFASGTGHFT